MSGDDGVVVDTGDANGWGSGVKFSGNLSSSNIVFRSTMLGTVNGAENQDIGKLQIAGAGGSAILTADFSPVGSSNSVLQLYDANSAVLGTFPISNNSPINLGSNNISFLSWACGPGNQIVGNDDQPFLHILGLDDQPYFHIIGTDDQPFFRYVMVEILNDTDNVFVGFTNAVQIITPGGQPIGGVHALSVTAVGVTATRDSVSHISLQAAGLEWLEVIGQEVRKDGFFYGALGNTTFDVNNAVTAYDIGTNGLDGMFITLRPAGDTTVGLLPEFGSAGSYLEAVVNGSFNGTPNQALGAVRFTLLESNPAAPYEITASFAPIGSPTHRIAVQSNGVNVAVFPNHTGPVGRSSSQPLAMGAASGATNSIAGHFAPGTLFVVNGQSFAGDKLLITAETPSVFVAYHSEIVVHASGLSEFTIADVQSAPAVPVVPTCSLNVVMNVTRDSTNMVFSWIGTGYRLEAATTLANPSSSTVWTSVAGVSPVTVPTSGPSKFFRLVCP